MNEREDDYDNPKLSLSKSVWSHIQQASNTASLQYVAYNVYHQDYIRLVQIVFKMHAWFSQSFYPLFMQKRPPYVMRT